MFCFIFCVSFHQWTFSIISIKTLQIDMNRISALQQLIMRLQCNGLYKFLPNKKCSTGFSYLPPPPLTAQTEHSRDLKFGMEGPQGKLFGIIGEIFDASPQGWDMGVGGPTPRMVKIGNFVCKFGNFLIRSLHGLYLPKKKKNRSLNMWF